MGMSLRHLEVSRLVKLKEIAAKGVFEPLTPPWGAYFLSGENGPPKEEDGGGGTSCTFTKRGDKWYPHGGHCWGQWVNAGPLGVMFDFKYGPDPNKTYPDGPHVLNVDGTPIPSQTPQVVCRYDGIDWHSIALRSEINFHALIGWSDLHKGVLFHEYQYGADYDPHIGVWDGTRAGWANRRRIATIPEKYRTTYYHGGAQTYRVKPGAQEGGSLPLYVRHRGEWWFLLLPDSPKVYTNPQIFGWNEQRDDWFDVPIPPHIWERMGNWYAGEDGHTRNGCPSNISLVEDPWRQCCYAVQGMSDVENSPGPGRLILVEGRGESWRLIPHDEEAWPNSWRIHNTQISSVMPMIELRAGGRLFSLYWHEGGDDYSFSPGADGRMRGAKLFDVKVGRGYQLTEYKGWDPVTDPYHFVTGKQWRFSYDSKRRCAALTDGDLGDGIPPGGPTGGGMMCGGLYHVNPRTGAWDAFLPHGHIESGVPGGPSGETATAYVGGKHDGHYRYQGGDILTRMFKVKCDNGSDQFIADTVLNPFFSSGELRNEVRYYWLDDATPPAPFEHGVAYRVVQSDYSVADQLVVKFKLARADDPSKRPIVVTDQGELATWARINRYIKDMPLTGGESSNPMGFDSTQYGDQYELMARLGQAPAFLRHRDKTWHPMRRNIVQGPNDAGGSQGESPWNAYYDPITDRLNRPIYAGSLCIETLDFSEFETTGKLVRESFAAMDVAPDSPYGATGRQPARKGMPGGGFWVGYESLSITANAMPWDPVHGRLFMVNNQVSVSAEVMGGEAGPEPRTGPYRTWVIYTRDIYDSPRGKQMRVHLLPDRPGGCYLNGPSADSVQAAIWDGMLWVISYVNPSMTVDWQTGATHPEGMRGHGNSGYVIVQTLDLGDLDADWVDRTKSFPLNPMGNNLSAYLGGSLVACEDALMAFGGYREDLPEMPQPKKWYAITRSV